MSGNNKSVGGKQDKTQQKLWHYMVVYTPIYAFTINFSFRVKNSVFDYILFNKDKINSNWNLKRLHKTFFMFLGLYCSFTV